MIEAERDAAVQVFERHRPRLFGIAYRMLGTVEDAEDVLQESYLRWHQADVDAVRSPEAWLVSVTTRLAIDRLRRASVEREQYVGQWLPEPVATDPPTATDRRAEVASDLSMAFLLLLERLSPEERAAFLLHEVFDVDYDEIARVLEKSEANCRQIVHRARLRVREGRPRFVVSPEVKERLLRRFLVALVADDATWTSDGGGRVRSARRVVRGAMRVVRLALGLERKWRPRVPLRHELDWINGEPAVATYVGDALVSTMSIDVEGERIAAFYRVVNPDKVRRLARRRASGRRDALASPA